MRLIYGPWGKTFDAGWPPVIAAFTVAAYAVPRYAYEANDATALGIAALIAVAMAVVILLISSAVDDHVTERVENSGLISAVAAVYAAVATAFLGVCVSGPIVLTVACAILLFFAMLMLYFGVQKDLDDSEWWWGWRKALLALALIAGFGVWQYTHHWPFSVFAIIIVLMAQSLWTMHLWVRPARAPA
ncbi:MAG: hypothetical protein AAB927_00105 [Patescibacteria group bacterium]